MMVSLLFERRFSLFGVNRYVIILMIIRLKMLMVVLMMIWVNLGVIWMVLIL